MDLDESSPNRIGSTLRDKWVIEELLGVGGMASVYAARHKIGRRDAIKILHTKIAQSEHLRARFEQEAHAVNSFRHPGVVEIRDVDTTEDGAPFLVMELLEGESLAQRLNREQSLQPRDILEIAAQVLDVLAAAHPRGIIHRDIKPDNLFLSKDGKTKVLDFGIAKVRGAERKAFTTKAGVTLGTMAYMAPEQARGEEIDGRVDVYAVGATIFRSLAGRIVHDADSQAALVMRVIAHGAPRFQTVVPDIDPNVAAVIDRALAFERDHRYPDAATMHADVRAVLDGKAPPYASTAPPVPDRPAVSSLFDESSNETKGKPTVVPRARQQATPAPTTNVGNPGAPAAMQSSMAPETRRVDGALPSSALPSTNPASALTRVSQEDALPSAAVPSMPLSERVVIVPSRQGDAVRLQAGDANGIGPGANGGDVATVYGHAAPVVVRPPAGNQAPAPGAPVTAPMPQIGANAPGVPALPPVVTPFGELSALVRKSPSVTVLAIAGGAAVLSLLLVIVAVVWFVSGRSRADDGTEVVSPSATAARAPDLPPPPAPRRPKR
jgi:serine/threonine-protein kinase